MFNAEIYYTGFVAYEYQWVPITCYRSSLLVAESPLQMFLYPLTQRRGLYR